MKTQCFRLMVLLYLAIGATASFAGQSAAQNAQSAMQDAQSAYHQGRYDEGIAILLPVAEREPQNAGVLELIAVGYHWKKDYVNALYYYDRAEKVRGTLSASKVMLLYEVGRYDDVIRTCADVARKGPVDVSVIGALISSYMAKNQPTDAQEFVDILRKQEYGTAYEKDYRNYILAYWALWRGDPDACRASLKQVSERNLKNYAKTDPRFKLLWSDPAFLDIVNTE